MYVKEERKLIVVFLFHTYESLERRDSRDKWMAFDKRRKKKGKNSVVCQKSKAIS